jgi:hypothetical protein
MEIHRVLETEPGTIEVELDRLRAKKLRYLLNNL